MGLHHGPVADASTALARFQALWYTQALWTSIYCGGLPLNASTLSAQYRAILSRESRPVVRPKPRMLGVLLCYNDADILADVIEHLLINDHDLVVWDHGSTDGTAAVLDRYQAYFVERRFIPRSVDFYGLYQAMSQNLIDHHIRSYDWVSWPDQDEILEGPDRSQSYAKHVEAIYRLGFDWIEFNNINYWWTRKDVKAIESPIRRVRNYSCFPNCAPRIRAWRASKTNIRLFNHNGIEGIKYDTNFNLRHYPMRSEAQMVRRITHDRSDLQRGILNYHYTHMAQQRRMLEVPAKILHFDDGVSELSLQPSLDWRDIYGSSAAQTPPFG